MTKIFTKNDLVQLLYNDINEDVGVEMLESLCTDKNLESSFAEMDEAKSMLDGFKVAPSDEVVSRILYFSKNLKLV